MGNLLGPSRNIICTKRTNEKEEVCIPGPCTAAGLFQELSVSLSSSVISEPRLFEGFPFFPASGMTYLWSEINFILILPHLSPGLAPWTSVRFWLYYQGDNHIQGDSCLSPLSLFPRLCREFCQQFRVYVTSLTRRLEDRPGIIEIFAFLGPRICLPSLCPDLH